MAEPLPPNYQSRLLHDRLLALLAAGWIAAVVYLYWKMLRDGGFPGAPELAQRDFFKQFLGWQIASSLLVACAVALLPGTRWKGWSLLGFFVVSAVALLACSRDWAFAAKALAFALWVFGAANGARIVWAKCNRGAAPHWGIAVSAFIAAWIPLGFFLALFHLMRIEIAAPMAIAFALPGLWAAPKDFRAGCRRAAAWLGRLNPFGVLSAEAIWVMLAMAFVVACLPETGSDSSRQYLSVIRRIALTHGLSTEFVDWGRLMPKAIQSALAPAYLLGGFPLAKWFPWLAVAALALLVVEELNERTRSASLAAFAAAITLACPLLLDLAAMLYMDQFIALLVLAGFLAMIRGLERGEPKAVLLAALIMGCAGQVKYNVGVFCIVWTVVLCAWSLRKFGLREGALRLAAPLALLGLSGLPWYVFTWRATGNPVYPFMNGLFKSDFWPAGMSANFNLGSFRIGPHAADWLLFPWHAAMHSSRIGEMNDGFLGCALLALTPMALLAPGRMQRFGWLMAAIGAAMILGVARTTQYARYWLPAMPFLLIAAALAMGGLMQAARLPGRRWMLAPALPMLAGLLLPCAFWLNSKSPWPLYTGRITRSQFSATAFGDAGLIDAINGWIDPDAKVLVSGFTGVYTLEANAFEFPFWHISIHGLKTADDLHACFERKQIDYWLVSLADAVQTRYFQQTFGVWESLWADDRVVAAQGNLVLFRVSNRAKSSFARLLQTRELPAAGWERVPADPVPRAEPLEAKQGEALVHPFAVPRGANECRIVVPLAGITPGPHGANITLDWFDAAGQRIAGTSAFLTAAPPANDFDARLYSSIPAGAAAGRLAVAPWNSLPWKAGAAKIAFWER